MGEAATYGFKALTSFDGEQKQQSTIFKSLSFTDEGRQSIIDWRRNNMPSLPSTLHRWMKELYLCSEKTNAKSLQPAPCLGFHCGTAKRILICRLALLVFKAAIITQKERLQYSLTVSAALIYRTLWVLHIRRRHGGIGLLEIIGGREVMPEGHVLLNRLCPTDSRWWSCYVATHVRRHR